MRTFYSWYCRRSISLIGSCILSLVIILLKCTWHLGLYVGETHTQLARWDNSPHSRHATHTRATSGLKFILIGPGCHRNIFHRTVDAISKIRVYNIENSTYATSKISVRNIKVCCKILLSINQ